MTAKPVLIALLLSLVLASTAGALEEGRAATKVLGPEAIAPLAGRLNAAQQKELLDKGQITQYYAESVQTSLSPNAAAATAMSPYLAAIKPSIGIETLIVYPLPAALIGNPGRNLALYNIMHRYQSMKGIEYYSASRKAMRIFFTSSKLVKAPGDRSALPDPVYSAIEPKHQFLLEQEDSSFGKNLYDLEINAPESGSILLNMTNREQVWYGIIPVLAPRALSLYLYVQVSPDGKYVYFYGNTAINAAKAFGVEEKAKTSFTNRIIALFNWYAREMEAAQ